MEGGAAVTKEESVGSIKTKRSKLESRIESQHNTHLDLLSSLQNLVPDIVPCLDLSLNIISNFNRRNFNPTPPLPEIPKLPPKPLTAVHLSQGPPSANDDSLVRSPETGRDQRAAKFFVGASGSPLAAVRAMVALCLLQRVPFKPIDSSIIARKLESDASLTSSEKKALRDLGGESGTVLAVEIALKSIADENNDGAVELDELSISGKSRVMVLSIDKVRLLKEFPESVPVKPDLIEGGGATNQSQGQGEMEMYGFQRPHQDMWDPHVMYGGAAGGGGMMAPRGGRGMTGRGMMNNRQQNLRTEEDDLIDIEEMLNKKTYKESQRSKAGEELLDLIQRPTAKETAVAAKFKSKGGSQVKEYCSSLTKEDCRLKTGSFAACEKVHFRRIIAPHTDISLGDCSFLDTCRHMKTCKYIHYELDPERDLPPALMGAGLAPQKPLKPQRPEYCSEVELGEPQWINCDIRNFRMDILGQFGVIMADPPWDIHMELPYGTMADDEMRNLNVPALQTDGLIFLWVTGRAMELGRECLELWGYKRVEEIIWVKTNQLQRIIRTGRTGHWLNHSKEHCLVGIKGNPEVNRNIDTDVIVAEVRETSRKPDEMYPMLERISPRTRKLELFARMHNTHAGWMSLGNQLEGVRLVDEGLRARFKAAYPEVVVQPASPGCQPTFRSYNVVLDVLVAGNCHKVAPNLFYDMLSKGISPTVYTFGVVMKALCMVNEVDSACSLLRDMTKHGCVPNSVVYQTLIHALSKSNRVSEALMLLEEMILMGCTSDVQTFNDVIHGLCKVNRIHEAAKLVDRMLVRGFTPDDITYGVLMHGLCRTGRVDEARALLNKIPSANVVLLNTVINGYVISGRFDEAKAIFYDSMLSVGCNPDVFTFNILIHGLCKQRRLGSALELVNAMAVKGCEPNIVTYTILVDGFCKEGQLEKANIIVNEMLSKGLSLNTVGYNCLIHALCSAGKILEAMEIFGEMPSKGCKRDIYTFNSIISGLCKGDRIEEALGLYQDMLLEGVTANTVTYNTLIHAFLRRGSLHEAHKLVNDMLFRGCPLDEITYNGLIKALCNAGAVDKGLGLFEEMMRKGIKPSSISCNILINGLCRTRKANTALEFLRDMIHRGLTPDIVTYNSLINGLCKMGCIREALNLFDKLQAEGIYPDAVTYNTLISWHFKEGLFDDAFLILHKGVANGFVPNDATWYILVRNLVKEINMESWNF